MGFMNILLPLIGGFGLFLLGMILMTDSLKTLAGNRLKEILGTFTGGSVSAITSGAVVTTMVQASAATALATIGFVSAGLITLPQAIGIIFGANLGTTSTAWLVAVLGFKYSIAYMSFPLVGLGAMLRLMYGGRRAALGTVLAGFGLLFIGIHTMQQGMDGLAANIDLSMYAGESLVNRLLLVIVGIVMTVLMQSSSAAIATTLIALHSGTISMDQGAAMVIGQNIGTTVTVAFAGIGATTTARRTVLAHVLFNLVTGIAAFFVLPLLVGFVHLVDRWLTINNNEMLLALFHTFFNLLGVVLLFPFIPGFARLLERIVPERGSVLTRNLDDSIVEVPAVAVETARRTVNGIAVEIINGVQVLLEEKGRQEWAVRILREADHALLRTRQFMSNIKSGPDTDRVHREHISVLHAIDHLDRLIDACWESESLRILKHVDHFTSIANHFEQELNVSMKCLQGIPGDITIEMIQEASISIAHIRKQQREDVLDRTAKGQLETDDALRQMEAVRWIDRMGYHLWRTVFHLVTPGEQGY